MPYELYIDKNLGGHGGPPYAGQAEFMAHRAEGMEHRAECLNLQKVLVYRIIP